MTSPDRIRYALHNDVQTLREQVRLLREALTAAQNRIRELELNTGRDLHDAARSAGNGG
jgi:hypothetical protein